MGKPESRSYEFGHFRLDTEEQHLIQGGQAMPLTPKLFALLLAFVQNSGRTLSKEELMQTVWPDTFVNEGTIQKNISRLKKVLKDGQNGQRYIETLSGRGYRFTAEVSPVEIGVAQTGSEPPVTVEGERSPVDEKIVPVLADEQPVTGNHFRHSLAASILYASLYAVALLVEVAYQYDRYERSAWIAAAIIFCWMGFTSAAALYVDWKLTMTGLRSGNVSGLFFSASIFLSAAALLFVCVRQYLPAHAITQASFETYTAQGAYLKEIIYFLILAAFFLIATFHFILSMERGFRDGGHRLILESLTGTRFTIAPKGNLYPALLTGLLMFFAIKTTFDHTHLFDNLSASSYKNLFIQLMYVRLILYFALAAECLIWYYRALNRIKLRCARAESEPAGFAR